MILYSIFLHDVFDCDFVNVSVSTKHIELMHIISTESTCIRTLWSIPIKILADTSGYNGMLLQYLVPYR